MIRSIMAMMFAMGIMSADIQMQSEFDFQTTLNNIKNNLQERGSKIFAEFDHSKNATEVQMQLMPSTVIVFGNPKVGTLLMQENPGIALELPLRIAVYQSNKGVFVSTIKMQDIAKTYKIKNSKLVQNIAKMLNDVIKQSTHHQ